MILIRRICCLFLVVFAGCLAVAAQTPVLTNRTPDAAKVSPTPAPGTRQSQPPGLVTLDADPALYPPGRGPKPTADSLPAFAYYVCLRHVSRVLVADSRGQVDDLFDGKFVQKVRSATYQFVASDAVYVIVPLSETYSIQFEANQPAAFLEILRGRGNTSPDEAIRYRDLLLDGKTARFALSPNGIGELRLDTSKDGGFASTINPSISLRGPAAHDTSGPEIHFRVLDRTNDTVLIAIDAKDSESGVKSLSYSLDGQRSFRYRTPVRADLKQTSFIMAYADDHAANRTVRIFQLDK